MKKRREYIYIYMQDCIISIGVALFRHSPPSSILFCHLFRPLFASFSFFLLSVKKKKNDNIEPLFFNAGCQQKLPASCITILSFLHIKSSYLFLEFYFIIFF